MRRLRRAVLALSIVSVLLGAVLLGWTLHGWSVDEGVDVEVKRPLRIVYGDAPAKGSMPNVLGLDEQAARQALADSGVEPSRIASREVPQVGERGIVVDQVPAATMPSGSGEVVLALSVPATVPQLVGKLDVQAREELERLGATVAIEGRYRPGSSEGTVLAVEPAPGAPLTGSAALTIAEAPSSVFLSQLTSVDSDCATETVNLDGSERKDAIVCDLAPSGESVAEYVLNRRVDLLRTTVGVGDRAPTGSSATFRVVVDGRTARTETVTLGSTQQLVVPTRGALRVRLEARAVGRTSGIRAVWASPAFQGGRATIDALAEESS
jgi:hypothetical protein